MKLDNFKNSPISIISFIALTFLFSYLIIGNLEIAGVTTVLSTWIFMMPRLTFENSTYKDKLPKFLKKGDIINKILSILIPLVFWGFYAVSMQNETLFTNPLFGLLFVIMPIIPAAVQYFILTHSDSSVDWVCPFVMAILTFLASEFVSGNLVNMFKCMFPFFFGNPIVITQLWSILLEILTIYAVYRIVSIIIPSRTLAAMFTSLLWLFFAIVQNVYIAKVGVTFKFADIFSIKEFIATLKVLFISNGLPVSLLIQGVGLLAAITIIIFTLNKWATIYDFKERLRGFVVGIAVFATCIFCFGFTRSYATKNHLDIYKGTSSTLISEFGQKNTFSESFQEAIDKEMIDMGWKEMETVTPTEPGATDTTTPTETTPTESDQLIPPVDFE